MIIGPVAGGLRGRLRRIEAALLLGPLMALIAIGGLLLGRLAVLRIHVHVIWAGSRRCGGRRRCAVRRGRIAVPRALIAVAHASRDRRRVDTM
jgi:hypothetical protein